MATSTLSANPFTTTYSYGPNGTTTSKTAANTGVDPLLLQRSTADLLGFQSQATEYAAAAEGSRFNAAGAGIEAEAYGTAAGIAGGNQQQEAIAESVRQLQILRNVDQTVGGIKAGVASNGFQQSGSALDIMQSSYRQGYLDTQISGLQSEQVQRGYLEQAAAANGEMAAAQARQLAALSLAGAQDKAGASATANQAALTQALTSLLAGDPNAQQLVNDLLAGNLTGATTDALLYNPNGTGQPLTSTGGTTTGATGTSNQFSTNPNIIARPPVDNVLAGQAFGVYGLTSGSSPSVGQANNLLKMFG